MKIFRIATRRSPLARRQTQAVGDAIVEACAARFEPVLIQTQGDRTRGPLWKAGGKGLFTRELEQALRSGDVDMAIHSAKDVPTELDAAFSLSAVGRREDPRDALFSPSGGGIEDLPDGATVGTSSRRRAAQVLAVRPDLTIVPIRGNVETRLVKVLDDGGCDATVMAMAGLNRLGLPEKFGRHIYPLAAEGFIPAAGQGILAAEWRSDNTDVGGMVEIIRHTETHEALLAEREVLRKLSVDCHSCIAVHVVSHDGAWEALGMAARPDGSGMVRLEASAATAADAGSALCDALIKHGAKELLHNGR